MAVNRCDRENKAGEAMKWTDYLFTMIFVLTVAAAFFVLLPAYTDYNQARSEARRLQQELLERELQAHLLRRRIHDLKHDPVAIERIARERLGWCREDEKIYHFEGVPVDPAE